MLIVSAQRPFDGQQVGGKAAALIRLAGVFQVPSFLVLVPEHQHDDQVPPDLSMALEHDVGGEYFAVRSSANVEDGSAASFAGIFETRLGVTMANVPAAVVEVVASASTARVAEYAATRDLRPQDVQMSVVIQKMLNSDRSGVCLTRRSRESDSVVVEAVFGLGELLVSGDVEPSTYVADRGTLAVRVAKTGYQARQLRLGDSGPEITNVPSTDRNAPKLLLREVTEVVRMSLAVERFEHYRAADIEWAYHDNRLFLLQARPYVAAS